MARWYRDLAQRVKCFPPAVTNKWRPADRGQGEAVWELSHALSKVPKPSVPLNILQREWSERKKKELDNLV